MARRWESTMFAISPPPPEEPVQDPIDRYRFQGDEGAFLVFLHHYEPVLNRKVNGFLEHYGLHGHFADLKMVCVETLWQKLAVYGPDCTVPFLKFSKRAVQQAMLDYAAGNLKGFSGPGDKQHYRLRTAAYLYKSLPSEEEAVTQICLRLHVQPKTARRLICDVLMLDSFVWYSRGNKPQEGQDVLGLLRPVRPEQALLRKELRRDLHQGFHQLSYLEQCIVSKHLGFYKECFRPLVPVSFEDLADQYQYATADGVRKVYRRALTKLRRHLETAGWDGEELPDLGTGQWRPGLLRAEELV